MSTAETTIATTAQSILDKFIQTHPTKYSAEQHPIMLQYLNDLNPMQRIAIQVAEEKLGDSFHVLKSNGFRVWRTARNE